MTPVTRVVAAGLAIVVIGALPAAGSTSRYGHTGAADRQLRDGCHNYRYHYVIKTPTNDWTLETFLVDPTGDTLASGTFLADSDPRRGKGRFRFCRYSTRPGTFTIRAKVHWYDDTAHKRWFKPSTFRLRR
jgi:hypothetical protein